MGEHNNTHRTEEELHSDIVSNSRGDREHNNNDNEHGDNGESNSVSPSVIDVEASVVSKAVNDDVKENASDAVDYFSHNNSNHDSNHDNDNSVDKDSNDVTSAQHNEQRNEQHDEHSEHNEHVANVDYDNKNSIDNDVNDDVNDEQGNSSVRREIVLVNDTNDIEQIETDDISDDYLIRPDKPTYMPRYLAMLAKTIIAVKGTLKAWRYQNSITYIEGLLYEEISEDRRDFLTDLRNEKQGELKELRTTMKDLLSLPSNQIVNEKYKQTLMLVDDNTDIKK